jgi:hypothetical protein
MLFIIMLWGNNIIWLIIVALYCIYKYLNFKMFK